MVDEWLHGNNDEAITQQRKISFEAEKVDFVWESFIKAKVKVE